MVRYVLIALLGVAIGLFGVLRDVLWLVPIGVLLIVGNFVWHGRVDTSAPAHSPGQDG